MKTRRYISSGKPFFKAWRIFYFTLIFVALGLFFLGIQKYRGPEPSWEPVIISIVVAVLVVLIRLSFKVTVVSMSNIAGEKQLEVKSLLKQKRIRGPFKCERWWNYNFSKKRTVLTSGRGSKAGMNSFFMYCLIEGVNGKIVLYEEVLIAPRNVSCRDYNIDGLEKEVKTFKVWNLNRCLRRIGLGEDCGG